MSLNYLNLSIPFGIHHKYMNLAKLMESNLSIPFGIHRVGALCVISLL
ncbi:hypothetical protein YN1HA_18200 [Sulfurisphaera ohwakuensis]